MSPSETLAHLEPARLYAKLGDAEHVYLDLAEGFGVELELEDVLVEDGVEHRVTLQMDVRLWRALVEGWMASAWGQHPERDHATDAQIPLDLGEVLRDLGGAVRQAVSDKEGA